MGARSVASGSGSAIEGEQAEKVRVTKKAAVGENVIVGGDMSGML